MLVMEVHNLLRAFNGLSVLLERLMNIHVRHVSTYCIRASTTWQPRVFRRFHEVFSWLCVLMIARIYLVYGRYQQKTFQLFIHTYSTRSKGYIRSSILLDCLVLC